MSYEFLKSAAAKHLSKKGKPSDWWAAKLKEMEARRADPDASASKQAGLGEVLRDAGLGALLGGVSLPATNAAAGQGLGLYYATEGFGTDPDSVSKDPSVSNWDVYRILSAFPRGHVFANALGGAVGGALIGGGLSAARQLAKKKPVDNQKKQPDSQAPSTEVKSANVLDTIGGYGQQALDFGQRGLDSLGDGMGDAWRDFQAWRGWKQLQNGLGNAWDGASQFAQDNPELVGAGLGAIGGGLGLTGLQSIGSAISGVPQTAPLMQRGLTNAAIGGLLGAGSGFAYRAFNQQPPRGILG